MKNCKYCNEFMCGQSGTNNVSEHCGNKIKPKSRLDEAKAVISLEVRKIFGVRAKSASISPMATEFDAYKVFVNDEWYGDYDMMKHRFVRLNEGE